VPPADLDSFIRSEYPQPDSRNGADRLGMCRGFWSHVAPADRVPLLLGILGRYRSCRQRSDGECDLRESFALAELIAIGYRSKLKPSEQESFAILRTAYHTCAHGDDVRPPVDLALRHFARKPYSPELFEALHAYRATLSHSRPSATQSIKARIDFILWQDLAAPWKPCWTTRIRDGVQKMGSAQRNAWAALFQSFVYTDRLHLPEKYQRQLERAFSQLLPSAFSREVRKWIAEPPSRMLTSTGSHVLKNLIWCAVLAADADLDAALTTLVEQRWKIRYEARRLARFLVFLWEHREDHRRASQIERIYQAFPDAAD
jgi:hypothetical protein